jgi:hypothetical protein
VVRRSELREAEGSLTPEVRARVVSSPDKAGTGWHCQTAWVRQARWKGIRKEPALKPLNSSTSSNLADMGWDSGARPRSGRLLIRIVEAGREATRKGCGVLVAMPQGHSRMPTPSIGRIVNVGTIPRRPDPGHPGRKPGRRIVS